MSHKRIQKQTLVTESSTNDVGHIKPRQATWKSPVDGKSNGTSMAYGAHSESQNTQRIEVALALLLRHRQTHLATATLQEHLATATLQEL